eukprot:gene16469-22691_t
MSQTTANQRHVLIRFLSQTTANQRHVLIRFVSQTTANQRHVFIRFLSQTTANLCDVLIRFCPTCRELYGLADVERILDARKVVVKTKDPSSAPAAAGEELHIKWKNKSYIHCSWVSADLVRQAAEMVPGLKPRLTKFYRSREFGLAQDEALDVEEDRVLAEDVTGPKNKRKVGLLVKWKTLGHEACSWEDEADLGAFSEEIARFREQKPIQVAAGKKVIALVFVDIIPTETPNANPNSSWEDEADQGSFSE